MLEALKATWPCFDLKSLIHPGTESWSTDWYIRGGPLQVMQHMGLGWSGWQCPEAQTVHSRTTSVAVHHLMDGTGGAVCVGKWEGRQLQKQSSSHTHTNPNNMCNLSNTALFKDCQRLSLSVLHHCLHLDTQIRKLPESNQQFTSWLNTRRPQSLHDRQQFHHREINADKTEETKKDRQKSGLHLNLFNS